MRRKKKLSQNDTIINDQAPDCVQVLVILTNMDQPSQQAKRSYGGEKMMVKHLLNIFAVHLILEQFPWVVGFIASFGVPVLCIKNSLQTTVNCSNNVNSPLVQNDEMEESAWIEIYCGREQRYPLNRTCNFTGNNQDLVTFTLLTTLSTPFALVGRSWFTLVRVRRHPHITWRGF